MKNKLASIFLGKKQNSFSFKWLWGTLLIFIVLTHFATAQDRFTTRSGAVFFEASVPSFEPIKATNKETSAVLDMKSGNFAVLALVRGFRFRVALMEEHFNENYIESYKFPKTSFKGKIVDFNIDNLSNKPQNFSAVGYLYLHGITKEIEVPLTILLDNNQLKLSSTFSVKAEDFGIKIPSLVRKQIAEIVEIRVDLDMLP
jgi:hypothetical protein